MRARPKSSLGARAGPVAGATMRCGKRAWCRRLLSRSSSSSPACRWQERPASTWSETLTWGRRPHSTGEPSLLPVLREAGRMPDPAPEPSAAWLLRHPGDHWFRRARPEIRDPMLGAVIDDWIAEFAPSYAALAGEDWSAEERRPISSPTSPWPTRYTAAGINLWGRSSWTSVRGALRSARSSHCVWCRRATDDSMGRSSRSFRVSTGGPRQAARGWLALAR